MPPAPLDPELVLVPPEPELVPPELVLAPPDPVLVPLELVLVLPELELVSPALAPLDPVLEPPVPAPELPLLAPPFDAPGVVSLEPPEQPPAAASATIAAPARDAGRATETSEREPRALDLAKFMRERYYVRAGCQASRVGGTEPSSWTAIFSVRRRAMAQVSVVGGPSLSAFDG
jgi:hypothetical protein